MLVHAAAGGVGTAAIQVARALNARVIAAVGSPEKLELCRELGAEEAYVYDEIPDDLRVDVVVDPVGGELFEAAVGRLRPLGQLVAIGFAGGLWPELQPAQLVGPERRRPGRLHRPPPPPRARRDRGCDARAARAVERTQDPAGRRRGVPARGGRGRARARRVAPQRRQGRARPVRALVTGGRGGIGSRDLRAARRSARARPAGVRRRRSAKRGGRSRASSTPPSSTPGSGSATPTSPSCRTPSTGESSAPISTASSTARASSRRG